MNYRINEQSIFSESEIKDLIHRFSNSGSSLHKGRNEIKIFRLNDRDINVKAFRIPNLVNKFAYRFIRKSKAQRSFEYANKLLKRGINTPFPIAYVEHKTNFAFLESYYISEHLEVDLTYRDLVKNNNLPDYERILREFTAFTFELHEKEIEFLDHSPGNTLIRKENGKYQFFLVDLNRMNFKALSFEERMKNFSRLTPQKKMVRMMANEYARLADKTEEEVFQKMWFYTEQFQEKIRRKKKLKSILKNKK
ncbi:Kdo domain containing protein [Gramella sp. GC03-9]|uniref:Kdo domain containing protein n=1 Tax=Christiangramia oceanisediminis TaxID=2920386 RepID=A0A9X2RE51_9FLAO|nr:lipopolysaccharide kinase InaA family protein [Gramella oceanisediminis]MCP9201086.1 Kdo domain containing protein [Gramella oceanisediminis]